MVQARNTIMLQHLIIHFCLSIICQVVVHRKLKNKRKFQTFSPKSGHGRLPEIVANHRFPNKHDKVISVRNLWYFEKLVTEERWSQPEVRLYFIPCHKNKGANSRKVGCNNDIVYFFSAFCIPIGCIF